MTNSCLNCWYHSSWYRNNGINKDDWYYFCNITGEELPIMKYDCEHYKKDNRMP